MTYPWVGPLEVPTPTALAHPTTKEYVDDGLATKSNTGHSHGAPAAHAETHAEGGDDPVSPASIGAATDDHGHTEPLVPFAPDSFSDGATITLDASQGTFFRGSLGGNRTLAVPTNGTDGQRVLVEALASGAERTLTINASISRGTGIDSPITIPSGKRWFGGLLLSSGTWYLIASIVEA